MSSVWGLHLGHDWSCDMLKLCIVVMGGIHYIDGEG